MPYVSGGEIGGSNRGWSLTRVWDTFLTFVFGVVLFFRTLLPFSIGGDSSSRSQSRSSSASRRGPSSGFGGGRNIGGLSRSGGAAPPPCGAGGG
ncbi:hypothetical protein RvY_16186-2 [Ramazzottius varieornatus]|uniref:Selenoprotein K n=1 Tax=Ramazzottius varieornatus TaxID=947166 RepID=A0A1D1W215_RAMVA|nr:hypothetical protein RvY_16186-2 [Ramazzottius varieornatus]